MSLEYQKLTVSATNINHKEESESFLVDNDSINRLSSIVLVHLSLEHYIPLFQNAGVDLRRFLNMTEEDFIQMGLCDPTDLTLLSNCSKALNSHIQQTKLKQQMSNNKTEQEEEEQDFFSLRSTASSSDGSNGSRLSTSSSITTEDLPLTPIYISESILKTINAFDIHSSNEPKSPPPSYNNVCLKNRKKVVIVPPCPTTTAANTTSSGFNIIAPHPVHNGTPPSVVIPRPRLNKNKQSSSRPLSMPIQLPSFATPPPDYHNNSIYSRRLEKCRSMIFPREEEGREELPSYSCTVFKMGYVYVKKEFDAPNFKSKFRVWRKLYIELWGTVLKVYRAAPTKSSKAIVDYASHYRGPLGMPYYYYHKYYYTPIMTIPLGGADAIRALDYSRRPNALRLSTPHGPQMLFRLSTHVEMISWIEHLQAAINISLDLEFRPMPKFVTIPNRAMGSETLDPRTIELERIREQRRRNQREVLI